MRPRWCLRSPGLSSIHSGASIVLRSKSSQNAAPAQPPLAPPLPVPAAASIPPSDWLPPAAPPIASTPPVPAPSRAGIRATAGGPTGPLDRPRPCPSRSNRPSRSLRCRNSCCRRLPHLSPATFRRRRSRPTYHRSRAHRCCLHYMPCRRPPEGQSPRMVRGPGGGFVASFALSRVAPSSLVASSAPHGRMSVFGPLTVASPKVVAGIPNAF